MENFETLDTGGSTGQISSEHRDSFREAGKYMKIYTIVMFVAFGLLVLGLLLFFAAGGSNIYQAAMRELDSQQRAVLEILWPMISIIAIVLPVFMIVFFIAFLRLNRSASALSAASFTGDMNDFRSAMANMRMYWMIVGIGVIAAIVFGIFIAIRMASIISQYQ
ncbi:MAG TPA: hypothetical protein PK637_16655 [Flavobacteriales bacterium]|nr:hypothetical protein [Flavobacteriales bacterium]HRE73863.1 hypothetical protein [Flavobacteriales bacterium]HRE98398.1 hypothetical protein [Flavobacteriales bacterium]HRJ34520.1 hypothetical protein [Flavobacteriales bacterium]HRJ39741.1 hypothetical protein [Flavobacteriales bacterium]